MKVEYNQKSHGYNFEMFKCNAEKASRINDAQCEHNLRDNFDRDRDRIMYSKAFRRLDGKTQIFLAGKDDHSRNRLTHTLEVSQIARTITKALGLNEVLAEAIALGHDIGHTPFGHVGERTLNQIVSGCYQISGYNDEDIIKNNKGFKHNWQSIKVATLFSDDLQLTKETLWGMLIHSNKKNNKCNFSILDEDGKKRCNFRRDRNNDTVNSNCNEQQSHNLNSLKVCSCLPKDDLSYYTNYKVFNNYHLESLSDLLDETYIWSIEGYIVAIADEIAQRHHDIEDAIEYNLISPKDLVKKLKEIFNDCVTSKSKYYKQQQLTAIFNTVDLYNENQYNYVNLTKIETNCNKEIFLKYLSKFIVNLLTSDVIHHTASILNNLLCDESIKIDSRFEDIRNKIHHKVDWCENLISPKMLEYDKQLKDYLKDRILNSYEAQRMDGMGEFIIRELFKAYVVNPQQLPDKSIVYILNNFYKLKYTCGYKTALKEQGFLDANNNYDIGAMRIELKNLHYSQDNKLYKLALIRTICDYIAGMTDKYAMNKHRELYNIKYE